MRLTSAKTDPQPAISRTRKDSPRTAAAPPGSLSRWMTLTLRDRADRALSPGGKAPESRGSTTPRPRPSGLIGRNDSARQRGRAGGQRQPGGAGELARRHSGHPDADKEQPDQPDAEDLASHQLPGPDGGQEQLDDRPRHRGDPPPATGSATSRLPTPHSARRTRHQPAYRESRNHA